MENVKEYIPTCNTGDGLNKIRFIMNSELYKRSSLRFRRNIYEMLKLSIIPNVGQRWRFTFIDVDNLSENNGYPIYTRTSDNLNISYFYSDSVDGYRRRCNIGYHDVDLLEVP